MEKLFYTNSSASSSQPRNSRVSLHKLFRFQFPAAEQQGEEAQARVPLALLHICACGIAPQLAGSLFFQGGNGYK